MSKGPHQGRAKHSHMTIHKAGKEYDKATKNPDAKLKGQKYSRITKAVLPK
jgi:hypothetical protein